MIKGVVAMGVAVFLRFLFSAYLLGLGSGFGVFAFILHRMDHGEANGGCFFNGLMAICVVGSILLAIDGILLLG